MTDKISALKEVLATSYALYIKTQNYHWNVTGPRFYSLHKFFEEQYTDLAAAVDEIAERIRFLGAKAPGSFSAYSAISLIKDASGDENAEEMVANLTNDQQAIIDALQNAIKHAGDDEATIDLLLGRVRTHEQTMWMLKSSI